jgi:hypothetical protein
MGMPSGMLIVSEVTRGAHGPYPLPDGPGLCEIRVYPHRDTTAIPIVTDARTGAEHYIVTINRTADWHDEDDGED